QRMRWRFDKPIPLNRGRSLDLRPCLGPLWHRGPHALFHLFKGLGNQYLLPLAREQTIPLFAFEIARQIDEVVLRQRQPCPTRQLSVVRRGTQRLKALLYGLALGQWGRRQALLELVGRDGVELDAVLPRHPMHHYLAKCLLFGVIEVKRPYWQPRVRGGERSAHRLRQPRHHGVLGVGAVAVYNRLPAEIPDNEVERFSGVCPIWIS